MPCQCIPAGIHIPNRTPGPIRTQRTAQVKLPDYSQNVQTIRLRSAREVQNNIEDLSNENESRRGHVESALTAPKSCMARLRGTSRRCGMSSPSKTLEEERLTGFRRLLVIPAHSIVCRLRAEDLSYKAPKIWIIDNQSGRTISGCWNHNFINVSMSVLVDHRSMEDSPS